MMSPILCYLLLAIGLSPDESPRLDRYGDALPEGAVARIGTLRFWAEGSELSTIEFSPDGSMLTAAGQVTTPFLWETRTGRVVRRLSSLVLPLEEEPIASAIAFSPDGQRLAVGDGMGHLMIGTTANGRVERSLSVEGGGIVNAVVFAPGGRFVAAAFSGVDVGADAEDRSIHTWDIQANWAVRKLLSINSLTIALAVSPDGETLASAGLDEKIRLWDLKTGRERKGFEFACAAHGRVVSFSPNGRWLAAGAEDGRIRIWNLVDRRDEHTISVGVSQVQVAFDPHDRGLFSLSDGAVRLWDVPEGRLKRLIPVRGSCFAVAPDGKSIALGSVQGVKVLDVDSGQERPAFARPGDISGLAYSRDGRTLASVGGDTVLWNIRAIDVHRRLVPKDRTYELAIAFLRSEPTLVTGGFDGAIRIWDTTVGREIRTLRGSPKPVEGLALSADEKLLASGSIDGSIRIWRVQTGEKVLEIESDGTPIKDLTFTADGAAFLSCSNFQGDESLVLRDVRSGKELRKFRGASTISCLSLSPDGKTLAAGSGGDMCTWDFTTGGLLYKRALPNQKVPAYIYSVKFSPDGRYIAWVGEDAIVRLSDAKTGRECRRFVGHESTVRALAFAPDAKTLASGGDDGTILIWACPE